MTDSKKELAKQLVSKAFGHLRLVMRRESQQEGKVIQQGTPIQGIGPQQEYEIIKNSPYENTNKFLFVNRDWQYKERNRGIHIDEFIGVKSRLKAYTQAFRIKQTGSYDQYAFLAQSMQVNSNLNSSQQQINQHQQQDLENDISSSSTSSSKSDSSSSNSLNSQDKNNKQSNGQQKISDSEILETLYGKRDEDDNYNSILSQKMQDEGDNNKQQQFNEIQSYHQQETSGQPLNKQNLEQLAQEQSQQDEIIQEAQQKVTQQLNNTHPEGNQLESSQVNNKTNGNQIPKIESLSEQERQKYIIDKLKKKDTTQRSKLKEQQMVTDHNNEIPDDVLQQNTSTDSHQEDVKLGKLSQFENLQQSKLENIVNQQKKGLGVDLGFRLNQHTDVLNTLYEAIENSKPALEVKNMVIQNRKFPIPKLVPLLRQRNLALKWMVQGAKKNRPKKGRFYISLAQEIYDAKHRTGFAVQKQIEQHRLAELNKMFLRYLSSPNFKEQAKKQDKREEQKLLSKLR